MGILVDASTPARWAGTPASAGSITSASFTAPANSLLVLAVEADTNPAGGNITVTVSDTGSLAWTKQVEENGNDDITGGYSSIWTAKPGTSAARTVSVTNTYTGGTGRISAKLYVLTGQDTTTPVDTTGAN